MRIKEIILDAIIGTSLFEMAFNRKQAIDSIQNQSYEIDLHLLKILMYGTVRDYEHWCSELNNWFLKIQRTRLKHNKQPLDFKTLYKILWEGYLESPEEVKDLMSDVDRKYSESYKLINYDFVEVHKIIQSILYDVSYDISHNRFNDIRNYL
jgi:mRNA-degrading endonuclease HigB of HigAB toxin-antitoxin module